MIEAAHRRCASIHNVRFSTCSGRDLEGIADARFDLVFAIDSFPYLLQAGMPLVETHFAEFRRVLRARGDLVILNFSYRDDVAEDRRDVAALADRHGFEVVVDGTSPFEIWNGIAFRLSRSDP